MGPLAPLDLEALALRATTGDSEAMSALRSCLLHSERESANRAAESIACMDEVFVRQVFEWMNDTGGLQDIMVWLLLVRRRNGLTFGWALRWLEEVGRNPGQAPVEVRDAMLRWLVVFASAGIGSQTVLSHALQCNDDIVALNAAELLIERSCERTTILERLQRVRGVSIGRSAMLRYRLGDPDAMELLVGLITSESPWALEAIRHLRTRACFPPRLQAMVRRAEPSEVRARLAGWMATCGDAFALELLRNWSHARSLRLKLCARAELLVCGTDEERRAILKWAQGQPQRMVEKLLDAIEVVDDRVAAYLTDAAAFGQLGHAGTRVAEVIERAVRYPCEPEASGA